PPIVSPLRFDPPAPQSLRRARVDPETLRARPPLSFERQPNRNEEPRGSAQAPPDRRSSRTLRWLQAAPRIDRWLSTRSAPERPPSSRSHQATAPQAGEPMAWGPSKRESGWASPTAPAARAKLRLGAEKCSTRLEARPLAGRRHVRSRFRPARELPLPARLSFDQKALR